MDNSTSSIARLPQLVPPPSTQDGAPCHKCAALCCRYYALQIDTPEDAEDLDSLRWYLLHGNSWIWVEDGDWYLQVDEACRYLGPHNECTIYDRRPQICREYGVPENKEHPDDPLCDWFAQDAHHDVELRTLDEFDAFAAKFLADIEERRRKRSAAARKAWEKRRGKG